MGISGEDLLATPYHGGKASEHVKDREEMEPNISFFNIRNPLLLQLSHSYNKGIHSFIRLEPHKIKAPLSILSQ